MPPNPRPGLRGVGWGGGSYWAWARVASAGDGARAPSPTRPHGAEIGGDRAWAVGHAGIAGARSLCMRARPPRGPSRCRRGDDLDTRLLRAMVLKVRGTDRVQCAVATPGLAVVRPGSWCAAWAVARLPCGSTKMHLNARPLCFCAQGILEAITTSRVNLVNADLLARNRGIKWVEGRLEGRLAQRGWVAGRGAGQRLVGQGLHSYAQQVAAGRLVVVHAQLTCHNPCPPAPAGSPRSSSAPRGATR